jgi:transposase-like protein
MLDGKHFRIGKRPHTLYVIQDAKSGRPFAWILLAHHETRVGYDALLDWTVAQAYQIEAVVSDGHKGLAASVHDHYPNAVHQRCAAHVLRAALAKLGGRWFMGMSERRALWREISFAVLGHAHKTDALNDLARLTKTMPTYLQVKWIKALDTIMVSLPGLYAFEQRPNLGIPRTSNRMEALMGSLQQRLKTSRGFENPETLTGLVSTLLAEKIPTKK